MNRTISGLRVLGQSRDLPGILDNHLVTSLLVSSKSIDQGHIREAVKACEDRGISIFMTGLELHPLTQPCDVLGQDTLSTRPA